MGPELVFAPEDDPVKLADDIGRALQRAVVARRREEKPYQRQVER